MIGDFVEAVIRDARDDDALAGSHRDIDVIDADPEPRDDPALASSARSCRAVTLA